jgi:fructose-1,6-bisphosphatase I
VNSSVVTIERHIIDQERQFPEATGAFSNILYEIALAAKMINREVNKAGLVDILGATDATNVHGETVRKLDLWAHDVIFKALDHGGHLCCMASEEAEQVLDIPSQFPTGEVRAALRSARRVVEHRRQRLDRDDFFPSQKDFDGRAR